MCRWNPPGYHPACWTKTTRSTPQDHHKAWDTKTVPQDWKDAQLIALFIKSDRRVCGNYCGISLPSIPGKVFARILLNRLSKLPENVLPETQCGFRPGQGTVDMIFSLKQIQEKCIEQNRPLYMGYL